MSGNTSNNRSRAGSYRPDHSLSNWPVGTGPTATADAHRQAFGFLGEIHYGVVTEIEPTANLSVGIKRNRNKSINTETDH